MTVLVSRHRPTRTFRSDERRLAALLVSPTTLVLALFVAFPIVMAIRQSFYGAAGLDPETGFVSRTEPFVGLANYLDIFTANGGRFWNAFANTTVLTVAVLVPEVVIGVAMALVMERVLRGRGVIRAVVLIPWAIPTAISGVLWAWIFNADGAANALLGTHILWGTEGLQAKIAVIVADVWKTAPFIGLLTLAGLMTIPGEVHEAATIDGAGPWRRFWSITLPLVKPALAVAVLFRLLDALRMFDLPYTLVGPRVAAVETLSMLAQDEAFNVRYGSASAYAFVLFVYVFLIALAFVRLLSVSFVDSGAGLPRGRRRAAR